MLNLKIDLLTFSKHSLVAFAPVAINIINNNEEMKDISFLEYIFICYIYNFTTYAIIIIKLIYAYLDNLSKIKHFL
tara:strand:+ start:69 stop:296 length:228 start_codon:yes stop_codon:yes gene_type:complete